MLKVLSTLSSMLTTAKNWGYACREIDVRKLVLPERNTHVAAHFTRSQVESIFALTQNPWRTFFVLLTLTGMWAGEALGLQWEDIDFDHQCIHIRRSVWYGKAQSTKSKGSAAPITLPAVLSAVLAEYKANWKPNPDGYLFVTRNGRPPSSNKVVEYQLWPILDALGIKRCGLHAFRHSVASFIVDAGYSIEVAQQQLRHSNARTTLGYTHFRGGVTEQAMTDVSNSLKLDAVGRGEDMGSFPYTNVRFRWKELVSRRTQLKVIRGSAFSFQLLRFLIGTRVITVEESVRRYGARNRDSRKVFALRLFGKPVKAAKSSQWGSSDGRYGASSKPAL